MSTPFLGIYRALYDYVPQSDEELPVQEGDILYLIQKSDFDDWWTVKRRVVDANEDEPQGLVPSTYIEPANTVATAKALFDYTKQTEEEISFHEGATLNVYDTSDPNWTLVDINGQQFGFVPANYVEIQMPTSKLTINNTNSPTSTLPTPNVNSFPPPPQRHDKISPTPEREAVIDSATYNNVASDEDDAPPMPSRPRPTTQTTSTNISTSRRYDNEDEEDNVEDRSKRNRSSSFFGGKSRSRSNTDTSNNRKSSFFSSSKSSSDNDVTEPVHGDFAWKIHEIDGKKKRRGVIEIGNNKIYLDIENKLEEQWLIKDLVNYNNEKKHVFLDFKSPSYSFELYVSNKDSANAIISILGDMKGLQSESALKEVKKAHNTGMRQGALKSGEILYDFIGQGGDELTVLEGDKISIVNDKKSKDWWLIENSNGDRGVVPSNYVKLVDGKKSKESSRFMKSLFTGGNSSRSPKKKSRASDKEERLLRENAKVESERDNLMRKQRELERKEKELIAKDREQRDRIRHADERLREKSLREESKRARAESNSSNSNKLPNTHRVRTWIDRSGSFKVEAEFLGLQEGKIHLHKTNGVKIAVAANKLSSEDLEYVERLTGTSLDKYKPKPQTKSKYSTQNREDDESTPSLPSRSGVNQKQKSLPINAKLIDYWFNFFVESGVDVAVCERYSHNFASEQVDENILSEITPALMRTLGVKEGDILRVKRFIDIKLGKSVTPEPMLPAATGTVPPPPPGIGTRALDPLPPRPSASLIDDSWATKPASKVNDDDKLTPQITGSIKDLLDVKPMEPTRTGITPVKPISTLPGETIGQLKDVKTGGNQQMIPMNAMPTGFMPITMIPMMTGALTGALTGTFNNGLNGGLTNGLTGGAMRTGGIIPITSFGMPSTLTGGLSNLYVAPQQQKTGGGFIMPLNTGAGASNIAQMPQTSFGVNNGMVKLQPTGVILQKTGGNIPSMQPTMKTGGFMPQSSFGMQITGGLPQTSFGNPSMMTGGLPQTSFGNPSMMTGGLPQASFGQQPVMNGGYQQQPQFGGMGSQMTGGFPQTSFGQPQQQNVPLQSQPTGFGFGNGSGKQANLANATASNPFGF